MSNGAMVFVINKGKNRKHFSSALCPFQVPATEILSVWWTWSQEI
jgi:hypothetical protein